MVGFVEWFSAENAKQKIWRIRCRQHPKSKNERKFKTSLNDIFDIIYCYIKALFERNISKPRYEKVWKAFYQSSLEHGVEKSMKF